MSKNCPLRILLTLTWLLIPKYLGATAIALIRTPDEIVAAADSKQNIESLTTGTDVSRNTCKIHKIRDNFYFAVAGFRGLDRVGEVGTMPQGGIFNIEQVVRSSHKPRLSIRENVDRFERSAKAFLLEILGWRQRNNPEAFKRNFSRLSNTAVVFFGIERRVMVVHRIGFKAKDDPEITIDSTRRICPVQCDPNLEFFPLGEMESYREPMVFNKNDGLPKTAKALVEAVIPTNSNKVGLPIDILRITRQEASWIEVKPECRK